LRTLSVLKPLGVDFLMGTSVKETLQLFYAQLYQQFGSQHWWPADTQFEVIVGAILTQNTNWGNVEKALCNLKRKKFLNPSSLHKVSSKTLASLIKPAGYFNVKTKRLKNFLKFLFKEYNGRLAAMGKEGTARLRHKLLEVNGIGPETADSILLYAFGRPVFVVDAYTKRFLHRHNMVDSKATYHEIQAMFMDHLDHDIGKFNEYHALIVNLGKDYCKPKPRCEKCPLKNISYSLTYKCRHFFASRYSQSERLP